MQVDESLTQTFYATRTKRAVNEGDAEEKMAIEVGWSSLATQQAAYTCAADLLGLDWSRVRSVLDVGCGYGHFSDFLRSNKGFAGTYTGIEILSDFVDAADSIYGSDSSNHFIAGNVLEHDWKHARYDIVVSLGVLSVNQDQPALYGQKSMDYAEAVIRLMSLLSTRGMCLYFPNESHYSPENMAKNPAMAFYAPDFIETTFRQSVQTGISDFSIESYPDPNNVRTMAKVLLDTS
ncbi:MAG: class I SAM-dependent methyltransferase [Verrucomicrobiota bacterium]